LNPGPVFCDAAAGRKGLLVELMPQWHLPVFQLTIAHPRNGALRRQVRIFREFACEMVPKLFPTLPK